MNNDLDKGVSNLSSNITGTPSVRLSEGKIPNIPGVMNGSNWIPICGLNFSDNNYGASLFCQKLDSKYTHGIINKKNVSDSGSENQSGLGIYIGKCRKDDKG